MRILMAHNFYKDPGGEDESYRVESKILEDKGHFVYRYEKHNDNLVYNTKFRNATNTIWNPQSYREISRIIDSHQIEIAHFQNTFPIISPSAYLACEKKKVPVIQALRNYRLTCLNALLYRDGRICHECLGKTFPYSGIVNKCYRQDFLASATTASMLSLHKLAGTYRIKVGAYIAISQHVKDIYVQAGLPEEKIFVKPNVVENVNTGKVKKERFFVYVGRINEEKGIARLLEVWCKISTDFRLIVIGDGPLLEKLRVQYANRSEIKFAGALSRSDVSEYMKLASATIVPSQWEEPFGRVVIESFSFSTPVISSKMGGLKELISEGYNGVTFDVDSSIDIERVIRNFMSEEHKWPDLQKGAYRSFVENYNKEKNVDLMERAYNYAKNVL